MFGIGPTELLVIGLLVIAVFGPLKAAEVARDLGRFINGANRTVEEFKEELLTEEVKEVRSSAEAINSEIATGDGQHGEDK